MHYRDVGNLYIVYKCKYASTYYSSSSVYFAYSNNVFQLLVHHPHSSDQWSWLTEVAFTTYVSWISLHHWTIWERIPNSCTKSLHCGRYFRAWAYRVSNDLADTQACKNSSRDNSGISSIVSISDQSHDIWLPVVSLNEDGPLKWVVIEASNTAVICDIDANEWQEAVMKGRERTERDEEEAGDMIHCKMVLIMAVIATLLGGQWFRRLRNSDNIIATSWLGIRPSKQKPVDRSKFPGRLGNSTTDLWQHTFLRFQTMP